MLTPPEFLLYWHTMEQNADRTIQAGLAIDGQKARTIREEKKLTQLYVANVVGVTTDTISRWENNRYPSIKKENAEKLAAALEVPLEELLRSKEEETAAPPPPSRQRNWKLPVLLLGIAAVVSILLLSRKGGSPVVAVRSIPPLVPPGEVLPVQLTVSLREPVQGFIVREKLPGGWRLVKASPPPAQESSDSEVRWLIPGGAGPVKISYTTVSPVATSGSKASFSGSVLVHTGGETRRSDIGGSRTVSLSQYHWADRNRDGKIDDAEIMPAYYLTEEMKGLGLDWPVIEAIWSGAGYRWDEKSQKYLIMKQPPGK